jgi:hypothetical protein
VLDHISLSVAAESDLVGVEGGSGGLAPRVIANKLGLTRLVATAAYNGVQVKSLSSKFVFKKKHTGMLQQIFLTCTLGCPKISTIF